MHMRRVVITGMGVVSPYGKGVDKLWLSLLNGESSVRGMPLFREIGGLRSHVGAIVDGIDIKEIPRKYRRSMAMMSIYATIASREALKQARVDKIHTGSGRMGVAIGSTIGSTKTTQEFFEDFLSDYSLQRMKTGVFFKLMNHSCAVNVSQALGITGRILSPSAACSTSCQAIGYGYEMVAFGRQDFMLCGGADELHPLTVSTFDIMNAASTHYNEEPNHTPRPFDRDRDGVVCSEGSGVLLLESLESAKERGVEILCEIIGFATTSDISNIANPAIESMQDCIEQVLEDAQLNSEDIDYINAHATATIQGDIAESRAIERFFGSSVPVSSLKGHFGHTMAASGAIEIAAIIKMIQNGVIIPTLNLENVDEECQGIKHIQKPEEFEINTVLKNNFALGGVNSSLVLRRYVNE